MTKVIDFQAKRKDSIEKRKRAFERVLFRDFLGSYAEIDEHGTKYDVSLIDISQDGCQFQIPYTKNVANHFAAGDDVTVRIYFTHDDFLPVVIKVRHASEYIAEDGNAYWRYGGVFDKSLPSFAAMQPFIEFIYKFAEYSCVDRGEHKVYFL